MTAVGKKGLGGPTCILTDNDGTVFVEIGNFST